MTLEKNTHHAEDGILKFAAPFWGKPRWAALFVAIAKQIQELEDTLFDIIESRALDNATGAQLALLGGIVGQADPGLGEDVFRNLIRVRIKINRSNGRTDDLIEIMQLLGIPAANRKLERWPPAKYRLTLSGTLPLPFYVLVPLLGEALGAGVGLMVSHGDFVFTNNTSTPDTFGVWGNQGSGGTPWANRLEAA